MGRRLVRPVVAVEEVEEEETIVVPKKVTGVLNPKTVVDELSIDSPAAIWDAGHVHLMFKNVATEGIPDILDIAHNLFATMRAELVNGPVLATIKALNYAKSLMREGDANPDDMDWSDVTADEITEIIKAYGGKDEKEDAPKKSFRKPAASRGRSSGSSKSRRSGGYSSGRSGGNKKSFSLKDPDAPMTQAQAKRIEADCEDAGVDLPDTFDDFTMQEASDFIQESAGK